VWGMSGRQEAMKGVEDCDNLGGAVNRALMPRSLNVVERFTRTDADTVKYEFTVSDPSTWEKSWSGEVVMSKIDGPIFEYACTEGNYGMRNNLTGARADEKKAAEKPIAQK